MTTSIRVKVPEGVSYRAKVDTTVGQDVVETVYLDPNSEREFYVWGRDRSVTITEMPLDAEKDEANAKH